MARIRTIKPEFWTDAFMVQLPHFGRLFYIALWSAADDHGFVVDEPERIAMQLMPREDQRLVDDWLQFFVAAGKLEHFVATDGSTYLKITRWKSHQKVDNPSRSRLFREGSRKVAIPLSVRRSLAEKYGCHPGKEAQAECFYCGAPGLIHWHSLSSGKPSAWVTFPGLEIDHVVAEHKGGKGVAENLVLSCRPCNRSKGTNDWLDRLSGVSIALDSPREASSMDLGPRTVDLGPNSCGEDATAAAVTAGTADANGEDGEQATSRANGGDYPKSFEEFWEAYPTRGGRKRGKCKCLGIWRQAIRMAERQPLVEAARNYAASDDATRGFAKDPESFLAKDWWRDWVPALPVQAARPPPATQEIRRRITPADFTK